MKAQNLEDLSDAESAFIDRTDVASQLHCLWRNSKEASTYVPGYLNVIAGLGIARADRIPSAPVYGKYGSKRYDTLR